MLAPGTGVLLPLLQGLMVSGVPDREPNRDAERILFTVVEDDRPPFHVLRAKRATLWQTPFGGTVLGSALKGVTVGSCRYFMYVIHRW